jgi:hypothetical protein
VTTWFLTWGILHDLRKLGLRTILVGVVDVEEHVA